MLTILHKISAMFAFIFALCTVVEVQSQAPVAINSPYFSSVPYTEVESSFAAVSGSSNSYSGIGTTYVSNSGLATSSSSSPSLVPDSSVEVFAHSMTQLLLTSPVLNAAGNFVITDPYALLYKISRIILVRANVLDPSLAENVAIAGRDLGVIPRDLYYNIIAHLVAKVLSMNNILTPESIVTYPRFVLSFIESYGNKNGISDAYSVVEAVANGVLDFATAFGLNNIPNITLAFQLFVQELKALASGAEI